MLHYNRIFRKANVKATEISLQFFTVTITVNTNTGDGKEYTVKEYSVNLQTEGKIINNFLIINIFFLHIFTC